MEIIFRELADSYNHCDNNSRHLPVIFSQMIQVYVGGMGSGKSACAVRNLCINPSRKITFSNIITKGIPNNILLEPGMIFKKELIGTKKTGEEIFDYKINEQFWQETVAKYKSVNLIIDEVHFMYDSRRSMSKKNILMNNFLSMIRRALGKNTAGYGLLTLITQYERRLDTLAADAATNVQFHICRYEKYCKACGYYWQENNESPEILFRCRRCGHHDIHIRNYSIEVWHFANLDNFRMWRIIGRRTFHNHYLIHDIEKYFPLYDTLQWDNLLEGI